MNIDEVCLQRLRHLDFSFTGPYLVADCSKYNIPEYECLDVDESGMVTVPWGSMSELGKNEKTRIFKAENLKVFNGEVLYPLPKRVIIIVLSDIYVALKAEEKEWLSKKKKDGVFGSVDLS